MCAWRFPPHSEDIYSKDRSWQLRAQTTSLPRDKVPIRSFIIKSLVAPFGGVRLLQAVVSIAELILKVPAALALDNLFQHHWYNESSPLVVVYIAACSSIVPFIIDSGRSYGGEMLHKLYGLSNATRLLRKIIVIMSTGIYNILEDISFHTPVMLSVTKRAIRPRASYLYLSSNRPHKKTKIPTLSTISKTLLQVEMSVY